MKVLALTVGHQNVASTQYRLVQFVNSLRGEGIRLDLTEAKTFRAYEKLPKYDLVIVQKRLMPRAWVRRIRKGAVKLIFDTDDAIWEPHGRKHFWWTRFRTHGRLRAIAYAADVCTVPNEHLANALRPLAKKVELVPMALDDSQWKPATMRKPGPIRIGWAGAPPNLTYLSWLGDVLYEVQMLRPEVELIVYCGVAPTWNLPVKVTHHPYLAGTEVGVVQTFDIGLLPLPNNAFAAGKSPIKALQYAACGVPCIASPVGATREIVRNGVTGMTATTHDEWKSALLSLIDSAELRKSMGAAAFAHFTKFHSHASVQTQMKACWGNIVAKSTALS